MLKESPTKNHALIVTALCCLLPAAFAPIRENLTTKERLHSGMDTEGGCSNRIYTITLVMMKRVHS
jgi:hypothetical protein